MSETNTKKILSFIGLARKAGALIAGQNAAVDAIRSGAAMVAILSSDAAEGTIKRITDKADFYGVKCITLDVDSVRLGRAAGLNERTAMVITNEAIAEKVIELKEN